MPGRGRRWLLAALVAASPMLLGAPASACSAGPFDVRAQTRVLVVGRITAIDLVKSETQPSRGSEVWYRKLVTMQVTHTYKGAPPATLRYWDAGIARYLTLPDGTQTVSWGGGGDCSTITEDVRGRYVAVALGGAPTELGASILLGSLVMTGPTDSRVGDLLARHGFTLPSTSTR